MMYPLSDRLPVTTRKYKPLPFPPSQQRQSQNRAAYSGKNSRNWTFGISTLTLCCTSTHSAQRINGPASSTKVGPKHDDIVGAHMPSESKGISDLTPLPTGAVASQAIRYHGQWKRLSSIGRGSYGQVYRALDITTGYIFAVKIVNSTKNKRRTIVQALQDERETLRELEHPNIVRYLGFEEYEGVLNIFLEYVPGGSIRSCLNTYGKFKEEVTKSFATQILQGLSYLHSKSILHRDLKSENILVEPRGICKISDFGISKKALETDRGRLYSIMKGTLAYMAPEMIDTKNKGYDSKIDIWSVGCIVFEMWTGKMPWSGSQDLQILMKLFGEEVAPTSGPPLPDDISLSTRAESFRQEFFYFDPEKRPSAAKLLQHVYLKLPPQWVFPGLEEIGQVSNTSSKFITRLSKDARVSPSHGHVGTIGIGSSMQDREVQSSVCQSIYSDIQAIAAEFNLSISNHAQRSPSLIQPMCSDVMDPQAPNLPFIPVTPPLKPRKQRKLCTYTTISGNTALEHSKRRPYVYQPPPLPEINVLSPYSTKLVPPISINYSKPISQTFSKRINIDHVIPANLLALSTDASSVGNLKSVVRPNLGNSGQQGAPYIPSPGNDNDDSDDDECYSSSIWQKPPADIPRKPAQGIKPVESASGWNIPSIHPHSPSAMPRPLVETVYRGLLSENVEENIDLPNAGGSIITTKMRYTMKSIREVVEARLSRAQAIPAQSSQKPHFWNSRMEEI